MAGQLHLPKSAERFCNGCEDYYERFENAQRMNEIFGTSAQWDFETCYRSCWRKLEVERIHENHLKNLYQKRKRLQLV